MQGKKNFTPQLFVSVNLLDLVPEDNFYRKLLSELNLDFIYKATQKYYGKEGHEIALRLAQGRLALRAFSTLWVYRKVFRRYLRDF